MRPTLVLQAAVSKIYASEAAWQCADDAVQLMGGLGYMSTLPFERIMRDLRIFRIFEASKRQCNCASV